MQNLNLRSSHTSLRCVRTTFIPKPMTDLYLSEIYIYPIKSLGGISVSAAELEDRGLRYDRRWMLVDDKGKFLTQRQHAQMALLQVSMLENGLSVSHKQGVLEPLYIPFEVKDAAVPELQVTIWDDTVTAQEVDPAISAWFTEVLGMPARLVRMSEQARRLVETDYAQNGEVVSFADSYPFLLIGQASLDDLNSRLEQPVPMNQFRPNFVFRGGAPFEEDTWSDFKIGDVSFQAVKPCARCVVTTINQETAEKSAEPLRTLAIYRQLRHKTIFGQNLLSISPAGTVQVGDKLEVLSWK
ncbi:MOSC domain-containing protein [Pontibacter pamirensis]|uniref:MOSC domain-containing protein n=1 Tax=Pontibacter pamirensis TaxID=2562824 RepID=UPI00293B899F|nr:MOSC N-terminal beta barrel domain-containing protein [Pontibacter pamirensis]